ncbi:hypothetical protein KKG90_05585 [Candidatus Bipolaricaulota bacterium]|nr:hypothetical protein [Candidatus Bipolaricaulota bacterium]
MKRAIQWTGYALIGFVSVTITAGPAIAQISDLHAGTIQVSASDGTYTDRIAVCWTPVEGATSYEVYRSTFLQHMYIPIAMTTDLSVSDKQIQASQYYYYKVRACQGG